MFNLEILKRQQTELNNLDRIICETLQTLNQDINILNKTLNHEMHPIAREGYTDLLQDRTELKNHAMQGIAFIHRLQTCNEILLQGILNRTITENDQSRREVNKTLQDIING